MRNVSKLFPAFSVVEIKFLHFGFVSVIRFNPLKKVQVKVKKVNVLGVKSSSREHATDPKSVVLGDLK